MGSSDKDKSLKKVETKENDDIVMTGEPPLWAWQLKHDIEEVRKIEVKVDALAMALKEIKQVISEAAVSSGTGNGQVPGSGYQSGAGTVMGISSGSGDVQVSGSGYQGGVSTGTGGASGGGSGGASGAGSSSGKIHELRNLQDDKKARYEIPSSTASHEFISDDIDVSKASKRAKAMGT
ncbi:hypothetical protein FOL47_009083, partial [Perkinsus chesapeaki]